MDDLADYLLKRVNTTTGSEAGTAGYDSTSETEASEAESDTNAVELPEDYVGRGNRKGERKAVRLVETGPRMELRLIKVVEGLVGSKRGEGETVFHEFGECSLNRAHELQLSFSAEHKSKAEASRLKVTHDEQRRLRDARRAEQAANVARKKANGETKNDDEEEEEDMDDVDVEGLSVDEDPEETLERIRNRKTEEVDDAEEFEYEDRAGQDEESDEEDWDEDVGADDVSSDEQDEEADDVSSEEDEIKPPQKKSVKLR